MNRYRNDVDDPAAGIGYLHPVAASLIVAMVALTPVAVTLRGGGSSALFYLLFLLGLGGVLSGVARHRFDFHREARIWRPLFIGAGLFLLVFVGVETAQEGSFGSGFEKTLRFALIVPLVLAFRYVEPRLLRQAQWGIIGATALMAALLVFPPATLDTRPDTVQYSHYNTVEFGNLTCLYAVLTLFFIGWPSIARHPRLEAGLKVLVGLFGLYGFLLSETRTGWLAVPAFLLVGLLMAWRVSRRAGMIAAGAAVVAALLVGGFADTLHDRVKLGYDELVQCRDEPLTDTSICIRVQLATASWMLFQQSPLIGVGEGGAYRDALKALSRQGVVSEYVAANFGEPHNDFLFYLASYGILGWIAAIAFIYLLPLAYFVRFFVRRSSREAWFAAAMGLVFCMAFAAFGLAEMMFRSMRTASLFAVWVAVFLALAAPARASLATPFHRSNSTAGTRPSR